MWPDHRDSKHVVESRCQLGPHLHTHTPSWDPTAPRARSLPPGRVGVRTSRSRAEVTLGPSLWLLPWSPSLPPACLAAAVLLPGRCRAVGATMTSCWGLREAVCASLSAQEDHGLPAQGPAPTWAPGWAQMHAGVDGEPCACRRSGWKQADPQGALFAQHGTGSCGLCRAAWLCGGGSRRVRYETCSARLWQCRGGAGRPLGSSRAPVGLAHLDPGRPGVG